LAFLSPLRPRFFKIKKIRGLKDIGFLAILEARRLKEILS